MLLRRSILHFIRFLLRFMLHRRVVAEDHVEISPSARIFSNVEIGRYTYIGNQVQIDQHVTKIGRYCSIASGCKLGLGPHPSFFLSTSTAFYDPERGLVQKLLFDEYQDNHETMIGNDVWIGANTIIMSGVKVGNGSIIGAGAVVTKDVPAYAIVVGIPAKIIKYRFSKSLIMKLEFSRWWEHPAERIATILSKNSEVSLQVEALITEITVNSTILAPHRESRVETRNIETT